MPSVTHFPFSRDSKSALEMFLQKTLGTRFRQQDRICQILHIFYIRIICYFRSFTFPLAILAFENMFIFLRLLPRNGYTSLVYPFVTGCAYYCGKIPMNFWFAAKANPTSYKLFMSMLVLLGLLLLSPEMHGNLVAVAAPMT